MIGRGSLVPAWLILIFVVATAVAAETGADRPAGARTAPGAKTSPDLNLNGVWRGFVVAGKGEHPDRGSVHLELTIRGDHITAQRLDGQGGSLGDGTYKIITARFYQMDATETRKRAKPKSYQGICAFGPDLMKWCVATPGNPRPATFETKGQQFLLILKRQP